MDIISHGLWGGAILGRKKRKDFLYVFGISVLPDILAEGVMFSLAFLGLNNMPSLANGHPDITAFPIYAQNFYNATHSMVIFGVVFAIIWLIGKKPRWLLLAWAFHIIIDIPTHSLKLFPTPFLWPISDIKIDGIPWNNPIILLPNIFLLILFYSVWFYKNKHNNHMNQNLNKRVCPAELAGGLDNVVRKWIHNPDKILTQYIKPGMTILDIGCGPGLYSIAMANMISRTGKVIAADLQQAMLDKVGAKIAGTELEKRIELHKTENDNIGVSEKVDFVLAFYMVHEVPDQYKFFQEIKTILKPDGKLFIIEPYFHVSRKDFEKTIRIASQNDLKVVKTEKVFFSRAVILEFPK